MKSFERKIFACKSKLGKDGFRLLHHCCSSCRQIIGLEHGRVDCCDVVETLLHTVVSAVVQAHLRSSDGDWALLSDEGCQFDCLLEALGGSLSHLAQEASIKGFFGGEKASRVC